jgi:hypothetical protein
VLIALRLQVSKAKPGSVSATPARFAPVEAARDDEVYKRVWARRLGRGWAHTWHAWVAEVIIATEKCVEWPGCKPPRQNQGRFQAASARFAPVGAARDDTMFKRAWARHLGRGGARMW